MMMKPDPTAYMGNYNFPQMLFAFCLGFVTMFVLSVNEMTNSKDVHYPSISKMSHVQLLVRHTMESPYGIGFSQCFWCLCPFWVFGLYINIIGSTEAFAKKHK